MSEATEKTDERLATLSVALRERCTLPLQHVLIALGFSVCFLYFNYIPLYHSDLWGHVSYGDWILTHQALPTEDPFVPLAEGVPVVATAWLSQVILAWTERAGGAEWLSDLFAVTVLLTYLLFARVFYLQTGRSGLAFVGVILAWLIGWTRHAVIRPEMFATLCFAALLYLIVRADREHSAPTSDAATDDRVPWSLWIGIPLLFLVWANLHGSFVVGFAVLGSFCLGRALEVVWQSRRWMAIAEDRWTRRWLLLTELAVAASLVNPYGMDLPVHTLMFSGNPNLNDVLEWFRLGMASIQGVEIGLSWVLLAVLLRHSRARMSPAAVILLMILIPAVCLRIRMLTWYAPVVVFAMMPHLASVADRIAQSDLGGPLRQWLSLLQRRSYKFTCVAALIVWICFAFSPASQTVLGGRPRERDQLYTSDTPFGVTEYLREHPPQGQIVNPQWWGDWLAKEGPPQLQVFMTTNSVHVVPPQVWRDYMAFATGQTGVQRRLDRYNVNTVVIHKARQEALATQIRKLLDWEIVFEDDLGFVAVRRESPKAEPRSETQPAPDGVSTSDAGTQTPGRTTDFVKFLRP